MADVVTVLNVRGNSVDPPRIRIVTEQEAVAEGSTFILSLRAFNRLGVDILAEDYLETCPANMRVWDWFQYIYFKWDRLYQNFELGKVEQGKTDFRIDLIPRQDAYEIEVEAAFFEGIYPSGPIDDEGVYKLIEDQINRSRWVYTPTTPLFTVRATAAGDVRVTADGNTRIANYMLSSSTKPVQLPGP